MTVNLCVMLLAEQITLMIFVSRRARFTIGKNALWFDVFTGVLNVPSSHAYRLSKIDRIAEVEESYPYDQSTQLMQAKYMLKI